MATFRQQDVKNPHFSLPFKFGGIRGGAFVNEEDSGEDIIDCLKAIIAYPIGSRHDLPDFGIPDLVFQTLSANTLGQIRAALTEWETRINLDVEGGPLVSDAQILDILVKAGVTDIG